MELVELSRRAVALRAQFAAVETAEGGRPWTRAELAQGFVGDVGALMKLLMAKDGRRAAPAGVRCVQLLADFRCAIFGRPERPAVCVSLRPTAVMCGANREEAMGYLERLERATAP